MNVRAFAALGQRRTWQYTRASGKMDDASTIAGDMGAIEMAIEESDWSHERLIAAARTAAGRAYAPYSQFRVGAVVVVEAVDGRRLVSGVNVENASYGLTLCAERAALAAACALGVAVRPDDESVRRMTAPRIVFVAISCLDAPPGSPPEERMPCGACRQWLAELAPDATYFVDGVDGALRLGDLLPHPFRLRTNG